MKKFKCGHIREDGMVFWAYVKHMPNGEYWVTADHHKKMTIEQRQRTAKRRERRKASFDAHPRLHNRGDVREDGMIFWDYNILSKGFENWVTPEQCLKNIHLNQIGLAKLAKDKRAAFQAHPRRHTKGDTREDGLVFGGYNIQTKGFERWVTPEQLELEVASNNERQRKRMKDPFYKMSQNIRWAIRKAFFKKNIRRGSRAAKILGCSCSEFKSHIESQFTEGMSWDNQGKGGWHFDHIFPVSAATTEEELYALNHYTNFQPMWELENFSKGDKHCPKELAAYLAERAQQQDLTLHT